MHYQQAAIAVSARQAEPLSDALMEHGALSTAIEDAHAGTAQEQALFGEPGMPTEQVWQQSIIVALFDAEADIDTILAAAAADAHMAAPAYQLETVPEQDWVRLTQSQFDPIQISERLWITPSWHPLPQAPDIINLQLDPGLAFGTGSHPTTHLCLQWLDQHLHGGENLLDYGCGSGILSIAAAKLGAGETVGVDVDDQALDAARANAAANHVTARYTGPDKLHAGSFDIVVANILSNPLKLLAPALLARVAPGGALVLSGVLERQAEEVIATYRAADPALPLQVWRASEGWVCLAGRRAA